MRISIHQPQYFPWFPYIHKIISSDIFIFLDTVDFQKNGLQNRNKILTTNGPSWLTVPVKQKLGQKIANTKTNESSGWKKKHMKTLTMNYGKLDFFKNNHNILFDVYEEAGDSLSDLNILLTKKLLHLMHVGTPTLRSSDLSATGASSQLLLNLCIETGATTYISGIGGKNYLDIELFTSAGIAVEFLSPVLPRPYPHAFSKFGSHTDLSVIDLLFNCGKSWRQYV